MMATAEEEVRRRLLDVAPEPNESLPFRGRVHLARRKKPDSWYIKGFEALLLLAAFGLLYATYYHFDCVHFHVNRFYANLGYKEAQHNLGHSFMHGVGADHHAESAVYWLKQASDQGHAKAQYNLAVSHLRGFNTGLQPGEAKKLIQQAADAGVPEAKKTLETICVQGGCEI